MKGSPVRVKCGNGMYIFVSAGQRKMLLDAKKRGVSSILSLDREQCELLHNHIIEGKGTGASVEKIEPIKIKPRDNISIANKKEYERELFRFNNGLDHTHAELYNPHYERELARFNAGLPHTDAEKYNRLNKDDPQYKLAKALDDRIKARQKKGHYNS
jgi:hypothetical protein